MHYKNVAALMLLAIGCDNSASMGGGNQAPRKDEPEVRLDDKNDHATAASSEKDKRDTKPSYKRVSDDARIPSSMAPLDLPPPKAPPASKSGLSPGPGTLTKVWSGTYVGPLNPTTTFSMRFEQKSESSFTGTCFDTELGAATISGTFASNMINFTKIYVKNGFRIVYTGRWDPSQRSFSGTWNNFQSQGTWIVR
jgi:hypothetical protein